MAHVRKQRVGRSAAGRGDLGWALLGDVDEQAQLPFRHVDFAPISLDA
jgi:hypothetical protein